MNKTIKIEPICLQVEDDSRRFSSNSSSGNFFESESDFAGVSRLENFASESFDIESYENEALRLLGLPVNNIEMVKRKSFNYSETFKYVLNSMLNDKLLKYHKEYSVYLDETNKEKFSSASNQSLGEKTKNTRLNWLKYHRMQQNYIQQQQLKHQAKVQQEAASQRNFYGMQRRQSRKVSEVVNLVVEKQKIIKSLAKIKRNPTYIDSFDEIESLKDQDSKPPVAPKKTIKFVRPRTALHRPKSGKPIINRPSSAAPVTSHTKIDPVIQKTKKEFIKAYSLMNMTSSSRTNPTTSTHQISNRRFADLACVPVEEPLKAKQDVIPRRPSDAEEIEYLSEVYKIRRYNLDDPVELLQAKQDLLRRYAFVDVEPTPPNVKSGKKRPDNTYTRSTIRFTLHNQLCSDALRLAVIYNKKL
jgi:hypothetical protein